MNITHKIEPNPGGVLELTVSAIGSTFKEKLATQKQLYFVTSNPDGADEPYALRVATGPKSEVVMADPLGSLNIYVEPGVDWEPIVLQLKDLAPDQHAVVIARVNAAIGMANG